MTPNDALHIHTRDRLYREYHVGLIDAPTLLRRLRDLEEPPRRSWLGTGFLIVTFAAFVGWCWSGKP